MSAWLSAFCRCRRSLSKLMLFAWFSESRFLRCLIPKSKPPCLLGAPDDPWDFSAQLHDTHQAYMKLSVCCGCLIVPFHHEQDLCLADFGVLMTRRTVWQLSRLLELRCEQHGEGELPCGRWLRPPVKRIRTFDASHRGSFNSIWISLPSA